jgi:polysaccharide deacetylase 2 family uncharacterized protein YibQ
MSVDDLTAPLGQRRTPRRPAIRIPLRYVLAGALGLFLAAFVLWAALLHNPLGGEPIAVATAHLPDGAAAKLAPAPAPGLHAAAAEGGPGRYDGPVPAPSANPAVKVERGAAEPANGTRTVNIIDGATGARQEVTIPAAAAGSNDSKPAIGLLPADAKFLEMTAHGPVPKIASDGVRPADAFAQPAKGLAAKPDAPRVALIVTGLGVSAKTTSDVLARLPGPVTLAFVPYGTDAALVGRARARGHEILLEVPMEPFSYPENDSGPQTLLTALTPQQNVDRLHWVMSRFAGYVGVINMMGARFTASEQSFAPILQEIAKRGLIFVDDGANPRSVAGRVAGADNLPFAKADVVVDAVPTPLEIERALGRLESEAREHHVAVGIATALPASIDQIAKWAKAAESRGIVLVPITAAAKKSETVTSSP